MLKGMKNRRLLQFCSQSRSSIQAEAERKAMPIKEYCDYIRGIVYKELHWHQPGAIKHQNYNRRGRAAHTALPRTYNAQDRPQQSRRPLQSHQTPRLLDAEKVLPAWKNLYMERSHSEHDYVIGFKMIAGVLVMAEEDICPGTTSLHGYYGLLEHEHHYSPQLQHSQEMSPRLLLRS